MENVFYAVFDDCGQYIQSGYNCTSKEDVKNDILELIEPETDIRDFNKMKKMELDEILAIKGWELHEDSKRWPDAFEEYEEYLDVSEKEEQKRDNSPKCTCADYDGFVNCPIHI